MRRDPNPTITSRMYRQFATVTLVLTAAVALFANGDNEQASAAQAADSYPPAQQPHAAKAGFRDATDGFSGDSEGWDSDDDDDFGTPMATPPDEQGPSPLADTPSPAQAPDRAEDGAGPAAAPTASQIAAAEAASRLRSGSPDNELN